MTDQEKITTFCMNQKSIKAAIDNFIGQFTDLYADEDKKEREILAQCIQQMFRKYYYSPLVPDETLTPAMIVNTLCERKFGAGFAAVPHLKVTFKAKKISRIDYDVVCFGADNHPMVKDMETFLQVAVAGIEMEVPGIPCASEYGKLKENLFIYDRHYINMIGLIALEAGFIECNASEKGISARTTSQSMEFFNWNAAGKLECIIANNIKLCSKCITESFPEFQKEFTVFNIKGLLEKTKDWEEIFGALLKKLGINLKQLDRLLRGADLDELFQANQSKLEKVAKLYFVLKLLDMYFFTPFGYYLQLIHPIYPELYDPALEMDVLLEDPEDFQEVRNKLFGAAIDFDLTSLGEALFKGGNRSERAQLIPSNIGDEEMYQAVISNAEYLEAEEADAFGDDDAADFADDDFEDSDADEADLENEDEPFQLELEGLFEPSPQGRKGKAQVIDFQARKKAISQKAAPQKAGPQKGAAKKAAEPEPADERVFVFKVKVFEAKRIWRQVEIQGTQTLHDLHEAIFTSFGMDPGHLYAFFMSNKFWDSKTEYAHPQAEGRSAGKIKLGKLALDLKQKFAYLYDFGDEYRFEVELVAFGEPEQGARYPRETKRNKPSVTVCEQCKSDKRPIEWYCQDHEAYLCDKCAQTRKHEECFITNAIL